jgi:starch-binding outer membrane protein, SusD/RagB family
MKTSRFIYIATSVLLFGSCSKDFLDKKPLTSFSEKDVFTDYALLDAYVLGTYRGMGHPFGGEGNDFTEGLTDNGYNQHNDWERRYSHAETTRDNGEDVSHGWWTNAYSNIRKVNIFFEKTAGSTSITPAQLKAATGEMRFLRAFFYAKLFKLYGGVPVITSSFPLGQSDYGVARSTADEVVDFVVKQCDSAMLELPAFAQAQRGRISIEAAMALKGRALLYAASPLWNPTNDIAKWTKARDANKAVMDIATIPLLSSPAKYHDIFNGRNNEEVILARYFTPNNAHGGGEWGSNLWLYPNGLGGWGTVTPTQDLVDSYELTNGKLPSDPTSGYNPQNPYINRDPRFYESILYNGGVFFDPVTKANRPLEYYRDKTNPTNSALAGRESRNGPSEPWNSSKTGYNFRKYTDEGKPAMGDKGANETVSPYIYFRKAEFLLNYAECQIALGNDADARTAINAVRTRVGMPAVTESGAALLARYRNERRVELVLEDLRFDDIRRWKIGPAALAKPAKGVDVYKNGAVIEYDYNYIADNLRAWNDKMYLLPIPYSEIQKSNSKLLQNPGY